MKFQLEQKKKEKLECNQRACVQQDMITMITCSESEPWFPVPNSKLGGHGFVRT